MKIVLRYESARNTFVVAEAPKCVRVKARCENSMYPNMILVDVPEEVVEGVPDENPIVTSEDE